MNKKHNTSTEHTFNINGTDDKTLRIIYDLHSLLCETNLTFAEGMAMLFGGCNAMMLTELARKSNAYVFKHWTPARKRNVLAAINSLRDTTKRHTVIRYDLICATLMRLLQADECLGGLKKASLYDAFDGASHAGGGEFWFLPIEQFNYGSVFRIGLRYCASKSGPQYGLVRRTATQTFEFSNPANVLFRDILMLIRHELTQLLNQNIDADAISRSVALIKHVQNFGTDAQKKALRDNGITFHI